MSDPTDKDLEQRMHRVFSELNTSIQAWFNGTVPNTDEGFEPVAARCHPEMTYVFPSGGEVTCPDVLAGIRGGWAANEEIRLVTPRPPCRLLIDDGDTIVAEALELQDGARAVTPPSHSDAPHGLLLRRLHESILSEDEAKKIDWRPLDGV